MYVRSPDVAAQREWHWEDDAEMIRRVNRKLDLGLLPLLSLLYLFNGLDRGNIGNAQTQGFTDDVGALPEDLNLAVSLFFVAFVFFQPLSGAVGWWLGPRNWMPIMMVSWGVVTIAHAFIWGRAALLTTRLLIGALEAGFYPTAVTYLASFYSPFDLAVRIGLFFGQYAIASAFSGALSYSIFLIPHAGLKAWQLLFIIEGAVTCCLALIAWIWLPAGPGTAWFLTKQERAFAEHRVRIGCADQAGVATLTRRDVKETAKDWKLWFALVLNICASVPASAFAVFLPLVVQGMGYQAIEANLMSVPPAACGAAGLYLFALSSDRRRERGYHITVAIIITLTGLIALVTAPTNTTRYAALCVLLVGSYVPAPLTVAWLSGNTPSPGKRALVLGVNGWGNLAGVIGSQLYRPEYAPGYRVPFFVTLGFVAAALAGVLAYRATLQAVNRQRAAIVQSKSAEEIDFEKSGDARYADRKWTFVYGL
ncbi:putative major facilitator superfamily transporter [Corynascus novoguineensis]|uniref:Major facilitator superfamily transporter n=1 Tax=Corynascus novoguineensis TaxID=1126955 RepID=A0AAN7CNR1_9PEZI|nr:putative major facilitator superfamily transporter [Corynascus novoguineensis]